MNGADTKVKHEVNPTSNNKQFKDDRQRLTDDQIVAHSVTFLLAGYETTSTALAYVSYMLALNPSIQEKLQNDIDCYFTDNPVSENNCVLYNCAWISNTYTVKPALMTHLRESGSQVVRVPGFGTEDPGLDA